MFNKKILLLTVYLSLPHYITGSLWKKHVYTWAEVWVRCTFCFHKYQFMCGKVCGNGCRITFFDTSMWVFLNNRASCHSESRPNKFHPSRQFRQTVCSLLGKAQGKNSMPSISDPVNGILLLEDVCVHVWLISPLPPPHGLLLRWPLLFLLSKLWKWAVTALRGLG